MLQLTLDQVDQLNALNNEQSLTFSIDSLKLLALRFQNQLYLFENLCPHAHKRLANDSMHCFDETFSLIECQFHSAQFNPVSGACVSGPCLGESLKQYQLIEQAGQYYLLTT